MGRGFKEEEQDGEFWEFVRRRPLGEAFGFGTRVGFGEIEKF